MMAVDKQEHLSTRRSRLRKRYVVFVIAVSAFVSYYVFQTELEINQMLSFAMVHTSDKVDITPANGDRTASVCDVGVLINPEDPRFYNIILEDEALQFSPCQDEKMSASSKYSKVIILDNAGNNTSYRKGEVIHARVDLYDHYGNKKRTGGDLLRATIHDSNGYHHAPGVVTDNLNGSYTVEIKAFWSGPSIIKIMLAYTREVISAVYRVRTEVLSTRNVYAKFTSGKTSQYSAEVLCHPNRTRLLAETNNSELCDLTYDNSGMSFYCVKPKNVHLLCLDWMFTSSKMPYPVLSLNRCEKALFERKHKLLSQHVAVNISEQPMCRIKPVTPCPKYDITKTWTSREPTGYFTGDKWNFIQCRGLTQDRIDECMRNTRLYLIGDSTLRHWYVHLVERKNCTPITENWTKEHWHKPTECVLKHIGFKAGWYPHSQPLCVGNNYVDARYTRVSIARRIENIPNDEHAIVVFQLYMHHLAFHHTVTQSRLVLIRKTVETFLNRNKNSVVLIKGPHTFSQTPSGDRLNDCNFGLYTKILYDTFKGLHDRVVLLNNGDATIASHNAPNHPPKNIVSAMVEQMFNFACK